MGKGNLFLGHGRGKMGNMVFTRQSGKQVFKTLNDQPHNPRSNSQQGQRSKFANANKFYSRGIQNLFKFAYDDKKIGETDFNAFMRHNIKSSIHISKECFNSVSYPAVGKWLMSRGPLNPVKMGQQKYTLTIDIATKTGSTEKTWGQWCIDFMEGTNYKNGDYLTLVKIEAAWDYDTGNVPSTIPLENQDPTRWTIEQVKLDTSSTALAKDILFKEVMKLDLDSGFPGFNFEDSTINGACAIVSRNTPKGVIASTSRVRVSDNVETALERANTNEYIEECIASWGGIDPAILQGQIVDFTY